MNMIQFAGMLEEHWHSYLHVMPGVNFVLLLVLSFAMWWSIKQIITNRTRIIEMELESRKKIEEGLGLILNKLDSLTKE